jgi:hypothetical protein
LKFCIRLAEDISGVTGKQLETSLSKLIPTFKSITVYRVNTDDIEIGVP